MKYIVDQALTSSNDAGLKARQDATRIAVGLGFKPFILKNSYRDDPISTARDLAVVNHQMISLAKSLKQGDSVVVQCPFRAHNLPMGKKFCQIAHERGAKTIALVHDITSIVTNEGAPPSGASPKQFRCDYALLSLFDKVIVHNPSMASWLESAGVAPEKIIDLRLFDYLLDEAPQREIKPDVVSFAGNLDPARMGFIYALGNLDEDSLFSLELFGPGYPEDSSYLKNVAYRGICTPDELPSQLSGTYGLIWLGSSIDTCSWESGGGYLMFNNPHKLSLYYASGLIPIVWDQSATARFVEETSSGLTVGSLADLHNLLHNIDEARLNLLRENAAKIGAKARSGAFLTEALSKALS